MRSARIVFFEASLVVVSVVVVVVEPPLAPIVLPLLVPAVPLLLASGLELPDAALGVEEPLPAAVLGLVLLPAALPGLVPLPAAVPGLVLLPAAVPGLVLLPLVPAAGLLDVPLSPIGVDCVLCWPAPVAGSFAVLGGVL